MCSLQREIVNLKYYENVALEYTPRSEEDQDNLRKDINPMGRIARPKIETVSAKYYWIYY